MNGPQSPQQQKVFWFSLPLAVPALMAFIHFLLYLVGASRVEAHLWDNFEAGTSGHVFIWHFFGLQLGQVAYRMSFVVSLALAVCIWFMLVPKLFPSKRSP